MHTVAIILARGNSKRVFGKNTTNFCGKPLLLWTIEQCQKVKEIDSIWVSSDDDLTLMLSNEKGCKTIVRPQELSEDNSTSISCWKHALKIIEKKQGKIDTVIAPQVSSPIRESSDIIGALHKFSKEDSIFMFSCLPSGVENGSFYVFKADAFEKNTFPKEPSTGKFAFQSKKMSRYPMESWKGYEIDYPIDLKICEVLMRHFLLNDKYYESKLSKIKEDFYKVGYYQNKVDPDGVSRNAERECKRKLEDSKEELAFINSLPSGNILDVGCGFGHMLFGVNDTWDKYGVEPNIIAADRAGEFCEIFQGTLQQAQYKTNFFDAVILYHVLEHLESPIEDIIEIRRILKPNGKLILGGPNFEGGMAQRFGAKYRLLNDPGHISLFGALGLFRLLTDLNFRVEKISYPYFDTVHFTKENLMRLFDISKVSPPFYGNIMTVYSHKQEA